MKLRLYLEEDSQDRNLATALRARAVNVLTASEANLIERTDAEQLAWAAAQGRALYSFNVGDFYQLHTFWLRQGRSHAGLILARQQRYTVGEQMRRLLKLIAARTAEEMKDRVEFLNAWG